MKRYYFLPMLTPKGVSYEIEVLQGGSPNYKQTLTSWNSILEFLQKKWYRRLPFRFYEPWYSWEVWADALRTKYFLWAPNQQDGYEAVYRIIIENPELNIKYGGWPELDFKRPHAGMKLLLERDFTVPMEIHDDPKIDSQSAFLEFLSNVPVNHDMYCQFLIRPVYERQVQRSFRKALRFVENDRTAPPGENDLYRKAIQGKQQHMKAELSINLLAFGETQNQAKRLVDDCARTLSYMNSGEMNRFVYREWWQMIRPAFRFEFQRRIFPFRTHSNSVILGSHELSGLLRPPSLAGTAKFIRIKGKRILLPMEVRTLAQNPDTILLGHNEKNIVNPPIHLPIANLERHLSVFGGSHVGKSTFLLNLLRNFLEKRTEENRFGFTVVDTKGSLADQLLERIPTELHHLVKVIRFRDGKVPFNPYDMDFQAGLSRKSNLIAEVFKKLNADHWNPIVAEHFLYGGIALYKLNMASLKNLQRLIEDDLFCKRVITLLSDDDPENGSIKQFLKRYLHDSSKKVNWRKEFLLSPVISRLRAINSSGLKGILNTRTNGIRWREAMDKGMIQILDLGGLPAGDKGLLGTMVITLFQQAMTSRQKAMSSGEHLPLHPLVVDDASLYVNRAIPDLEYFANEARKFQTPLILSISGIKHQMSHNVAETLIRNFGTVVSFQMGNTSDAKFLCDNLNSVGLSTKDYHMIEPFFSYIQMFVDNEKTRAFSLKSSPPGEPIYQGKLADLVDELIQDMIVNEDKTKEELEEKEAKEFAQADQQIQKSPDLQPAEEAVEVEDEDDELEDYIDMIYENNDIGKGYYDK